jgi:predicted DCC family thiol-disulfide oxidoreductase YuxK
MARPLIVYDDGCNFCTWIAERAVGYGPFEIVGITDVGDLPADQRERLPEDFEECSQFVTDEAVYSCGESAERVLSRMILLSAPVFAAFRKVPGYASFREELYHLVSNNRPWLEELLHSDPPAEGHASSRKTD